MAAPSEVEGRPPAALNAHVGLLIEQNDEKGFRLALEADGTIDTTALATRKYLTPLTDI